MTRHDSDSGPVGFQTPKIFRVIIFMTECLAMPDTQAMKVMMKLLKTQYIKN
jgi:hypothetical protein